MKLEDCKTFLDVLKVLHPECVGDQFHGGAHLCPFLWKLEETEAAREFCPSRKTELEAHCRDCWSRPVPAETLERLIQERKAAA